MTLDEVVAREAIRKTLALYNWAGDRAVVDDFVAAFTTDAVFMAGGRTICGKAAIRSWMNDWAAREGQSAGSCVII